MIEETFFRIKLGISLVVLFLALQVLIGSLVKLDNKLDKTPIAVKAGPKPKTDTPTDTPSITRDEMDKIMASIAKPVEYNTEVKSVLDLGHGVLIKSWIKYTGANISKEKIIDKNRGNFETIKKMSIKAGVEWADMVTDAIIESRLGQLNVCNEGGYCGIFQFGLPAWRSYGKGSRLNVENNIAAAIKYRKANKEILENNGIAVDGFILYLSHQQGSGGTISIFASINGVKLKKKESKRLAIALCNNIPFKLREKVCYSVKKMIKGRERTLWRKRRLVSLTDLSHIHFSIWKKEYEEIKLGALNEK